jgi:hypothetical protein
MASAGADATNSKLDVVMAALNLFYQTHTDTAKESDAVEAVTLNKEELDIMRKERDSFYIEYISDTGKADTSVIDECVAERNDHPSVVDEFVYLEKEVFVKELENTISGQDSSPSVHSRDFEEELKNATTIQEAALLFFEYAKAEMKILNLDFNTNIHNYVDSVLETEYTLELVIPRPNFRKLIVTTTREGMIHIYEPESYHFYRMTLEVLKKSGFEKIWATLMPKPNTEVIVVLYEKYIDNKTREIEHSVVTEIFKIREKEAPNNVVKELKDIISREDDTPRVHSRDFEGELKNITTIQEAVLLFFEFVQAELRLHDVDFIVQAKNKNNPYYTLESVEPKRVPSIEVLNFAGECMWICHHDKRVFNMTLEDIKTSGLKNIWDAFVLRQC